MISVILSEQDLGDFLENNQKYMESYQAELQNRLIDYFEQPVIVEISHNHLTDKFDLPNDDDLESVQHIMDQMVNDWSWLSD